MRVGTGLLAILAVSCVGLALPRPAAADEWNKETVLTFSRDVAIPGRVLPAGKYIFRLADSATNRHVVQVFDPAGRILATVLTIPVAERTPADDTRILLEERSAGAPFPIKKWFYPGVSGGEEFMYRSRSN